MLSGGEFLSATEIVTENNEGEESFELMGLMSIFGGTRWVCEKAR